MKILDISEIKNFDSKKLNTKEIFVLSQKIEILCKKNKILSISAIQLGFNYNLFVYCLGCYENYKHILDCNYFFENNEKYTSIEGCQSISQNKKRYKVERYENIIVKGKELFVDDFKINNFEKKFSKCLESCIFQHEIDHFNNISIDKIGEEIYIHESIKT